MGEQDGRKADPEKQNAETTRPVSRADLMRQVRTGKTSFDAVIACLCEQARKQDCILALAEHLDLPEAEVDHIFAQPDSSALAVLCRAAAVSDATYSELSQLRLLLLERSPEEVNELIRQFAEIGALRARHAVGLMRQRLEEEPAAKKVAANA